jgi:hypothetical protein
LTENTPGVADRLHAVQYRYSNLRRYCAWAIIVDGGADMPMITGPGRQNHRNPLAGKGLWKSSGGATAERLVMSPDMAL